MPLFEGKIYKLMKLKLLICWCSASKFSHFHKSEIVIQKLKGGRGTGKKKLTFSSWAAPLLRRWWQRGGYRRWPLRSLRCGQFASRAPLHQAYEWLLLKNTVMDKSQTNGAQIRAHLVTILCCATLSQYPSTNLYIQYIFSLIWQCGISAPIFQGP